MPTGVELATAWVRLTPTMEGVQGEVAKSFSGVDAAAETSGKSAGSKWSTGAKAAVLIGGAAIVTGLVKVFNTGFEEFTFGEKLNAQTDALVKNTKFALSTEAIGDYTLALSKVSGVEEEALQAAGNSIIKFGGVSAENYKRAVASVNDLAASGKDAAASGELLGKALADPATAAAKLKRAGVSLTEQQQAQIKTFTEAGDKAGAQGVILDALEGTYGGLAEKVGGTTEGSINKLNNSFDNMAGDLVATLMPAISGLVSGLDGFIGFLSDNQPLMYIFIGIIGLLTIAFIAITVATWAMNTALLANPITWIVLAIVAAVAILIAIIVLLVTNWDTIVKFLSEVWGNIVDWLISTLEAIGSFWNNIWTNVSSFFVTVWTAIVSFFTDIWNGLVDWFMGLLIAYGQFIINTINGIAAVWNTVWTAVVDFFRGLWDAVVSWFTTLLTGWGIIISTALNVISTGWKTVWNGIVSFFTGLWGGLTGFVGGVLDGISNAISNALSFIGRTWNDMWSGMVNFLSGVFSNVVGVVKKPINGIISLINGAIGAINGIKVSIPDWVPGLGGQTLGFNIPKIPMLATGGTITTAGYSIVGENGPELLKLPKGAQVNPDYDDIPDSKGTTFNNYAPLGQSPAQALTEFSNRAKGL